MRHNYLAIILIILIIIIGCNNDGNEKGTENSTSGNNAQQTSTEQSKGKLRLRINDRAIYEPAHLRSDINSLVRNEVIYEVALKEDRDKDQKVVDSVSRYKRNLLIGLLKRDIIKDYIANHKVTDEEIQNYYDSNITKYTFLDLEHITIPTKKIANEIYDKLKSNEPLGKLIEEYKSQDINVKSTDLINMRKYNDKFDELKEKSISKPIYENNQYNIFIIIRVDTKELNEIKHIVTANLRSTYKKKSLDEFVENAKKEHNLDIEVYN